jgi:hypothetical protein
MTYNSSDPSIMVAAQDVLGFDLLRMEHFFVARLGLDVVRHGSFARRIGQREAPENVLHRWRRKGVSASVRSSDRICGHGHLQ